MLYSPVYIKENEVKNDEKMAGELVTSVTISEILVSCGIQLVHIAHDIAFTDAAFGEAWSVETANRMASLSEILNVLYKRIPRRVLETVVDLPAGMIGVRSVNPHYVPKAEKPHSNEGGNSDGSGGIQSSIDDFPF
jgi:hypothetical protein